MEQLHALECSTQLMHSLQQSKRQKQLISGLDVHIQNLDRRLGTRRTIDRALSRSL